jgi:2-methylcitrate dehydratase
MDKTTQTLATYAAHLKFDDLTPAALRELKRRLVDSIGCAIGGYRNEPAAIARELAAATSGKPPARVLGSGTSTSMEMAAFANTVMVRYLDCNDTYVSKGSGHPSDMIPGCLAVAEARGASGKDTLAAIAVAYEVYTGLADVVGLRDLGWDQGVFVVLGTAAGAANLLRLTPAQAGDALAIAITANVPTRQTRAGELAMWKGCATAAATKAGVFAALLAQKGMTGPTAAFEGKDGIWEKVTGRFELRPLGSKETGFGVERSNLKSFPAEYHSQAPLWIALELRAKVRPEDIEAMHVRTYFTAWSEIGSEPEKWDPKTRETADHSLPYLLSAALLDGRITAESFSDARIRDPQLRQLMQSIKVSENPEFTRQFPGKLMSEIEVQTRGGQKLTLSAQYPKGHAKNPMNDDDVNTKFVGLCGDILPAGRRDALLKALWDLERAPELGKVLDLTLVERS